MRSFSLVALAGLSVSLLLTGCGFGSEGVALGVQASGFTGKMMGGQSPVTGATLTIYTFGTAGYGLGGQELATTQTDNSGNYNFNNFTCPQANTPVYMLGSGGNTGGGINPSAVLGVALGPCGSITGPIVINEVTTAAMAFTLAHYFNAINGTYTEGGDYFGGPSTSAGGITTYSQGILNATTITIPHIVNNQIGAANSNVNGDPGSVVESAKIYTIANIIAACINTTGPTSFTETTTVCGQLFGYTMDYANVRPYDTMQAAVQMALFPNANVKNLFNLIPPIGFAFSGGLSSVPQDFSIGISYTTSAASLAVPTAAIAGMDIDSSGGVWFPSNGTGQVGLANFSPAAGFYGPFNGTNMVNPTQVAIDNTGVGWVNDVGSNILSGYPLTNPSSPTAYPFQALPTSTTALTINDDDSIITAIYLAGNSSSLAKLNTARTSYIFLGASNTLLPVVSLTGDAVGGDAIATDTNTGSGASFFYRGPSNSNQIRPVATDSGLAGQVIFQGTDFVGLNTGVTSSQDELCVFTTQSCFGIYPQVQKPTNLVIDGESSLWAPAPAGPGVLQIPQYSTYATGGTSYLDTNFHPARAEANELFHGTGNGGTMVLPSAIAVDVAGNVWVANAGCTTTGCTPTQFVLSEVIGAAAPTITPLVNQIITNTTLTGTEPVY